MNARELRDYRRFRGEGLNAVNAFKAAKSAKPASDIEIGKRFQREGFDIVVTVEPDEDIDISFLGEFTDRPDGDHERGDYLYNHAGDRNSYEYFVPAQSVAERANELIRLKYGKRQAWELAWKYAKEDMETAREYAPVVVTVTVYKKGIELASDCVGGVDGDEAYYIECAEEMIDGALQTASESLRQLCEN